MSRAAQNLVPTLAIKPPVNMPSLIREILLSDRPANQSEIQKSLKLRGLVINQSTISRILKLLHASKGVDVNGKSFYQLPTDGPSDFQALSISSFLKGIETNGNLIVIQTYPGSAPYVARYIDTHLQSKFIGTIAGDDTVFCAPRSLAAISTLVLQVRELLNNA